MTVYQLKQAYAASKKKTIGEQCFCPSCGSPFKKKNYQQVFCNSQTGTKCKDKYWNTVDPKKRNNTTRISPASKRFTDNRKEYLHPFSGEALGQWED